MGDRIKFGKHKYSTLEIDAMRYYIHIRMIERGLGADGITGYTGLSLDQRQVAEEQLRTYMLNGTDPDELYDLAVEAERENYEKRTRFYRERHNIENPSRFEPIPRMKKSA
jgi:hypothetical protein